MSIVAGPDKQNTVCSPLIVNHVIEYSSICHSNRNRSKPNRLQWDTTILICVCISPDCKLIPPYIAFQNV